MSWLKGCDFSYSKPDLPQLWAAGYRVILIYLSDSGKGFTDAYANQALDIGFKILPLYETSAGAALGGYTTGVAHAKFATAKAAAQGIPKEVPIIYALDQQFSDAELSGPVSQYVKGLASVAGDDELYGGYHQLDYLIKHGFPGRQNFQTYAWSGGAWLPTGVAPIEQYHNGVNVAGGNVDDCRVQDNLIFWEKDMALTPDDIANIAKAVWTWKPGWAGLIDETPLGMLADVPTRVWNADVIPVTPTDPTNPNWQAKNALAAAANNKPVPAAAVAAAVVAALPPATVGSGLTADEVRALLAKLTLSVAP